jgi:SAM-dependent methyltransferase
VKWSSLIGHAALAEAFGDADPAQFAWQTEGAFVSQRERALVEAAFLPLGARVLDLGCAEGATLRHLGNPASAVGVDLFPAKLAFARAHAPRGQFVAGSAEALPFADGSFDHVLIRDLIHHIPDPTRMIDECARVLAPGGRIDVLEPCRWNPLIALHAITQPAERGELRSTPGYLSQLLARRFAVAGVTRHQALPLHRLVFHHRRGTMHLAERAGWTAVVDQLERVAATVMPRAAWAYIHVRAYLTPTPSAPVG